MFITKKTIPRRTVLRGLGASIALPLLDAMVPALSAQAATAAKPVRRLLVLYNGNGMDMGRWTPATDGDAFALSPIMQPLEPFQDRVAVITGLTSKVADAIPGEGAGDHSRAPATFLTAVHPNKSEGADVRAGTSLDQIVAQHLRADTQFGSLELSMESAEVLGSCDPGYSCAYTSTIAWRNETTPLPMEHDPRIVFERLFGGGSSSDPAVRLADLRRQSSLLDFVQTQASRLNNALGSADRAKLTQYLDAVRDIERRLQRAEEQLDQELPVIDRPGAVPRVYEEHALLMFDLLTLAFQADLTRVATVMMSRELSTRSYPEIGVPDGHHPLSHHQQRPEQLEKLARINTYHVKAFAYLVEKLRSAQVGPDSLLDQSTILFGAGISNSDRHTHDNLPILVINGGTRQGTHLRVNADTPLANLHLTLLERLGMPLKQFGDSTGVLPV